MDLRDRTVRQIEGRLEALGVMKPTDVSQGIDVIWKIGEDGRLHWRREMLGMGHNEPPRTPLGSGVLTSEELFVTSSVF